MCDIFILDNDIKIVGLLKAWLLSEHIVDNIDKIISSKNVELAKEKIEQLLLQDKKIPAIFLVDIHLNEYLDGINFLEWLKEKSIVTSVFAITEIHLDKDCLSKLLNIGVDGIIKKPFDFDTMYFTFLNILQVNNYLKHANIDRFTEYGAQSIKQFKEWLGKLNEISNMHSTLRKEQECH